MDKTNQPRIVATILLVISLMALVIPVEKIRAQEAAPVADEAANEPAPAVELTMEESLFTLRARDASLEEILSRLDELIQVDLSIAPALLEKRVTLDLEGVTYEQLMKELAASHALIYERDAQGNYRIVAARLTTQEALEERRLTRRERQERRRQQEEIRQVLKELTGLYGYAGVLDYDAAKALVQERNRRFQELVERLAALGPGGARTIQELYGEAGSTRGQKLLVEALGRVQDPEASLVLGMLYGRDQSVSMQREIISSLSKRADPQTLDVLTGILANEENTLLKAGTVMALAMQPGAIETLTELIESDRQKKDVRREAIRSLGQIGGDPAREVLVRVATGSGDLGVRRSAIQELGRTFGDSALGAFETLLSDPSEAIRFNTIKALARVKTEASRALLEKAAASDTSEAVRQTAQMLLAESGE